MSLGLKKALHKTKRLGNKVVKKGALGLKKAGKLSKQAAKVAQAVGEATNNQDITAIAGKLERGGTKAKQVAKGIEKIRTGNVEEGVKNFM